MEVLADYREDAAVLRRTGQEAQAHSPERMAQDVSEAARDYLLFLSEDDAALRSGHTERWLRDRYREWAKAGHAKKENGRRWYRQVVIPYRMRAAYEDGARQADAA